MGNAGPEREIQMTYVHMWVGAVVAVGLLAVGLLGGLGWFGSPGIPVVTSQNSLSRRARPLEIFGRPLNDVLFSREFRKSRWFGSLDRTAGVAGADSAVEKVRCDTGQTLTEALKKAKPGDTLQVTGTCHEHVTITTDRLTLDGDSSAVLDGSGGSPTSSFEAGVTIDGVQGVTLMGFTIQNSPSQGILGVGGAAFVVKDTTLQNNGAAGINLYNNSSAELTDVEVKGSEGIGLVVQNTSTAVLKGTIRSTGSGASSTGGGANGIAVQSGSTVEIRGASVHASDNGGNGLDIVDSQAIMFGFPESQGSSLTVHNNGGDGIFVGTGSLSFFGGVGFATISASNNGGSGMAIGLGGAVVSPQAAAKFIIEHNPTGLSVSEGGSVFIIGGLTVQNNQTGGGFSRGC
jgi:hypothetical protein